MDRKPSWIESTLNLPVWSCSLPGYVLRGIRNRYGSVEVASWYYGSMLSMQETISMTGEPLERQAHSWIAKPTATAHCHPFLLAVWTHYAALGRVPPPLHNKFRPKSDRARGISQEFVKTHSRLKIVGAYKMT